MPAKKKRKDAKGGASEAGGAAGPENKDEIQEGKGGAEKKDISAEESGKGIVSMEPTPDRPSPDAPKGMWHAKAIVPRRKGT